MNEEEKNIFGVTLCRNHTRITLESDICTNLWKCNTLKHWKHCTEILKVMERLTGVPRPTILKSMWFCHIWPIVSIYDHQCSSTAQHRGGGGTMGNDTLQIKWPKSLTLLVGFLPEITHTKFQLSSLNGLKVINMCIYPLRLKTNTGYVLVNFYWFTTSVYLQILGW